MAVLFNRTLLLIAAALAVTLARASGQVQLTDVALFSADANGNYVGPDIWVTRPDGSFIVWIESGAPGGRFLNGPTSSNAQPNISLPPGTSTFTIVTAPGADFGSFGINLFFNGSSTPSISATGPMLTALGQQHVFSADNALSTPGPVTPAPNERTVTGAGTLSAVVGNELVTLTDFYVATPSVYSLDQAGGLSTGPGGSDDYVGGITFTVKTVSGPQQWWLLAMSLLPVILLAILLLVVAGVVVAMRAARKKN